VSEKRRTRRALPGHWTDLITDGIPDLGDTFGRAYDTRVYIGLNSTALSAIQAGHTEAEWNERLDEPGSVLGRQARREGNRKTRTPRSYASLTHRVWVAAAAHVAENPVPGHDHTVAVIAAMRAHAADADAKLTDELRRGLIAVCDLAEKYDTTRPAVSLPELAARAGLPGGITDDGRDLAREHAWNVLRALCRRGLLTRERRGSVALRKAALYRLHPPAPVACSSPREGICAVSQGLCAADPRAAKGYLPSASGSPRSAKGYVPTAAATHECYVPPTPPTRATERTSP
jgi:hypothetical protein